MDDDEGDGLARLGLREEQPTLPIRPKQPWWVASSSLWASVLLAAVWLIAAVTSYFNLPASITSHDAWRLVFPSIATLLVILYVPSVVYHLRRRRR
ncbi:hypothetical protein AX769_16515 [Frondihabitans sp. PAMC 28766]|uniref:hypothetical protein n=1 Tax=Frondihabitans sp. PAMC 28766 TaxID=1795630 RepID=UPI00078C0878|nr:hypothetical protein [Frondihabitans sp. PAMC 28766]AMM21441.1 hypothetical protein AX769_16515 [Frondihabitans sp. PAMC 28766]